jgi:hypothetical protein
MTDTRVVLAETAVPSTTKELYRYLKLIFIPTLLETVVLVVLVAMVVTETA